MKPTKTIKTYSEEVRNEFLKTKESDNLREEIYDLTPANVRTLCLNLLEEEMPEEDVMILMSFFKVNEKDLLRNKIERFDIDKLRPICRFLKKQQHSLNSKEALDLIALFIDFKFRPYKKYRKGDIVVKERKVVHNKKGRIVVSLTEKGIFNWVSTASAQGKWKIVGASVLLIIILVFSGKHILETKTCWMVWNQDHYVEVRFDLEKYNISQLKRCKTERLKNFRKIPVDCNTEFFDSSGKPKIWYGKNAKKTLEYFTSLGLHPETGKTLKPITKYMINKYVCPTQKE